MKKITALAAIAALTVAGGITSVPVQAATVTEFGNGTTIRGYLISNGSGTITLPENCFPGINIPNPEIPGSGTPETETPETDTPELEAPETSFAKQVVALVNKERAKAGLKQVVFEEQISLAAQVRAREIQTSFSHTRPDGRTFSTALTDQNISFRGSGENIAWGQKTPEAVMEAWMNSEGHRANILNANFTKMGVGHLTNAAGTNYWVQLFTY